MSTTEAPPPTPPAGRAETKTRYRLTWGDGGDRFSDDLDLLRSRYSPEHGDRLHRQRITTITGPWVEVPE